MTAERFRHFRVEQAECPHCGPVEMLEASEDTWIGMAAASCPKCGRTFELA